MNILVVTSRVPYPLRDGGAIATFNQVKSYAALGHRVVMCCLNTSKHYVDRATIDRAFDFAQEVHTVDANTNLKPLGALFSLLSGTSYNITRFDVPQMHQELERLCLSHQFDLIQLEGLYTAPYLETLRKVSRAPLLLRQHNVEFRIWEKLAAHAPKGIKRWYLGLLSRRLKTYELNCLPLADKVAAITDADAADMKQYCPQASIISAPAGIDLPDAVEQGNPFRVFHLGSMEWMPNQEGVHWLLNEIWPLVKKMEPRASLHLAGKGLRANFGKPLPEGVYNDGEVEDAARWYAGFGISVVPLRAASGIRMKTLEALAAGKSVVSTGAGAAGLPLMNREEAMLADTAEAFAQAILTVMHDAALRERLCLKGRAMAGRYDRNLLAAQLLQECTQKTVH